MCEQSGGFALPGGHTTLVRCSEHPDGAEILPTFCSRFCREYMSKNAVKRNSTAEVRYDSSSNCSCWGFLGRSWLNAETALTC